MRKENESIHKELKRAFDNNRQIISKMEEIQKEDKKSVTRYSPRISQRDFYSTKPAKAFQQKLNVNFDIFKCLDSSFKF